MHPAVMIVTVLTGVFTLAIISVVVSKNAATGTLLTNAGTALSGVITAAVAPVSGGNQTNLGAGIGAQLGNWLTNPGVVSTTG